MLFAVAAVFAVAGCDDDNTSDLRLDGDAWLTSFSLDGYEGIIDNTGKTVTVGVPETYDARAMEVTAITASEGATTSMNI